jgi:carbamate kinase
VARNTQGRLEGVEAVINTDEVACLLAAELHAQMLLMVIERDHKFLLSGLGTESPSHLSLGALDEILAHENFPSSTVYRKLKAASDFLHQGGEQVIITTLRKLPQTLAGTSGLRIGAKHPTLVDFDFAARTPNVEVADDA